MADKRLIAAAPELLEALKAIVPLIVNAEGWMDDWHRDLDSAVDIARAAIAKAEGG